MARKIVIEFLGQDKSLGKTMGEIEGKSGKLSGVLGKVGKVAAVGFGAIVAGAGAVMVSGAKLEQQYSKTMSLVGAATNASADTMRDLDDLAMKMGAETAFSANEAAEAMLELAKAGVKTKDIMGGGLKNTLLLASAGGTDLATAATIASNAMNTFALKGKDMASVAAALAGGANASSASVESLGQGLQQVGPGATNAGMSLHETVAALSAFDAAGIKGSDAGTSLKTMLTSLVPATAKAKDYMDRYGLSFTNADGSIKSMTEVAGELKAGLGDLSDVQRTQAMRAIFGSDATRAATVLMKEGEGGIRSYIKATQDKNAAEDMAKAAMSGTAGAMERLRGSVETLQLKIGKALAPVLIEVANWLSTTGIPAFSGFATWLGTHLPAAFDRLRAVVQLVMGALRGDVGQGMGRVRAIFADAISIIRSLWDRFGATIVEYAIKTFNNLKQIIGGALKVVQGIFQTFSSLLRGDWAGAWDGIKKILSGAWEVIKGVVKQAMNFVSTVMEVGWSAIKGIVSGAWDGIKTAVSRGVARVIEFVREIPSRVVAALGNLGSTLYAAGASLIQGLIDGITAKLGALRDKLTSVTKMIPDWKGPLDKDKILLTPAGEALIEGLIAGIEKKKTKLQTVLTKITDHIKKKQDALASLLDRRQSIVDSFKGMASSVFGASLGSEESPASVDKLVDFQANQRARAEQLNSSVGTLIGKGLSKDMIRQLIESGQSGIDQINLLATATDAQIADLVANNAATQAALEAAGLKASEALIGEQIAQAQRDVALADTIRDKLAELLKQQDKNTVVQLVLDGKVLHASLLKLKREKRGNLELA